MSGEVRHVRGSRCRARARSDTTRRDQLHRTGSPWENPYVESFNSRARDELLNLEDFGTLLEAQVVVEAWRIEYNTYRPHGALGGFTPSEVRAAWNTEHQPALS